MIITVAALKSGGKTSTAIHFASVLNDDEEGSVCVLDLDNRNQSAMDWAASNRLAFPVFNDSMTSKADDFKHTVIDTGAGLSVHDLASLANGSDHLVMPTFPDVLNLRVLVKAAKTRVLQSLATPVHILLTNCPPRPSRDCETAKTALEEFGFSVLDSTIRRSLWLGRAALDGCTVDEVAGGGTSARNVYRDYESAVWEVMNHE